MTEQKNSSEKTEKTDRNEKPASAPKKPSIEPKSARGASTTARRKTAKEADAALQDKIEKARAGAMPERGEPAAAGESARADRARHAADQQEEGRDDVRREGRCSRKEDG